MDLPTCRACGQSVLDDDAAECPFCGASMKTGQGGKKPAAKPATAAPAKGKPAARSAAAPGSSGRAAPPMGLDDDDFSPPSGSASDDPFELERSAAQGAILLKPKPAKGLSLKCVCPMCETPGYTTSKAAGKEVRCANPKCLVPIFTAPAPQAKPVEKPPEPEPKGFPIVWALLGLLVVASGVGGAWFAGVFWDKPPKKSDNPPVANNNRPRNEPFEEPGTATDAKQSVTKPGTVAGPKPLDELRKQAYTLMIEAARDQAGPRGKAASRRMSAESAILSGEIEEGRKQIDQLRKVGGDLAFYSIPPLVSIAWHERAAGRNDAAAAAVNEAVESSKGMPPFGRETTEISIRLATILAAMGNLDKADELVAALKDEMGFGQLTTPYLEAWASKTYDMDAITEAGPVLPWSAPYAVAVTKLLAAHGEWDAGWNWAMARKSKESQGECLSAWTQAAARDSDAGRVNRLSKDGSKFEPALKARLFGVAAWQQSLAGRSEPAAATLALAEAALNELKPPAPYVIPEGKELIEAEPPDPLESRMKAQAAADVARAQAVAGKTAEAKASMEKSLAFARAIAPSLSAARAKLAEADGNASQVQEMLKSELKLKTNDEARRAYNNYRRQAAKMVTAAEQRVEIQSRVLSRLAATPLREEVNSAMQQGLKDKGPLQEPYLETSVPWILATAYELAGDDAKAKSLRDQLAAAQKTADAEQELQLKTRKLIADGKYDQAGAAIEASAADKNWKIRWTMITTARLVKNGKVAEAVELIRALKGDVILREETLAISGALAGQVGKARAVWEATEAKGIQPSEKAALYRGFIVAVLTGKPEAK